MTRLELMVAELPEAERIDIEEWGGHPAFRVRGKKFVFSDLDATHSSVKPRARIVLDQDRRAAG